MGAERDSMTWMYADALAWESEPALHASQVGDRCMKIRELWNESTLSTGIGHGRIEHDSASTRRSCSDRACILSTRWTISSTALLVALTALSLNGCTPIGIAKEDPLEPVVVEPPPMDVVLVTDLLRFFHGR